MKVEISEKIEYITSGENPLSSDVVFIKGDKAIWIFDVGANDEAFNAIAEIISDADREKDVNIVISHFHRDHMGNLERIAKIPTVGNCVNLYVSKYTYKHCNIGTVVEEDIIINDGVKIHIFPMPSSHSKGCLCLEADDEAVFIGDAIYPAYKSIEDEDSGKMSACYDKFENRGEYRKQHKVYNVQHLKQQIDILKSLEAKKIYLAHEKKPLVRREIIVVFLERIYKKREQGNPFILQ